MHMCVNSSTRNYMQLLHHFSCMVVMMKQVCQLVYM